MRALERRLEELEKTKAPPVEASWLAIRNDDLSYSLSHKKHSNVKLLNRSALDDFIENNSLNTDNRIQIIIADKPQGLPLIEL